MLTPERLALPKLGEAGGPPLTVEDDGATVLGARGRPAEPTPSHSRAQGALLALGFRQKRGVESAGCHSWVACRSPVLARASATLVHAVNGVSAISALY